MELTYYKHSPEPKYLTLQEVTDLLNAEDPPDQVTQRNLLRCAALNKFRIYFQYDGGLLLKSFDTVCEDVTTTGTYSYLGKLSILDYRYGMERGKGHLEVSKVLAELSLNLTPKFGSPMDCDIFMLDDYYFSPYFLCGPDDDYGDAPVQIGTEVKLTEITINPSDVPKIMDLVTSLKRELREKQQNDGRYTLEDAASIIAANSTANIEEIEYLLFRSIKDGSLSAYGTSSLIPITDQRKFNSIGMVLLYEIYQDNLNDWLKDKIPRLKFEFQNLCTLTTPEPVAVETTSRQANKLNRNSLDIPIDKAISQAGNMELADVYLQLKELALNGEKPFTGAVDGSSLCYTNDVNKPDTFTRNALGKRLILRRTPPPAATCRHLPPSIVEDNFM